MLQPDQWTSFLVAAVLVTLTPGPDNLMVLTLSAAHGRKHGMSFGLGCAMGCLSHTALAALGIAALVAASPIAFVGLRVAGAAYLVRLGVQAWAGPAGNGADAGNSRRPTECSLTARFVTGVVANAINPKVILFFLAFLPRFADPDATAGTLAVQIAQLGVAFTFQAAVIFSAIGYFFGAVGDWLHARQRNANVLNRCAGVLLMTLGALLVLDW